MSRTLLFAVFSCCFIIAATLVGCKDDTTGPGKIPLGPISNLRAFSASATSVGLVWSPSQHANEADFLDHQITVTTGTPPVTITTVNVAKTATSTTITGLTEGTVYTFSIVARASSGSQSFSDSPPRTIVWAPARRLELEGTLPIDVYEIRSTAGGSGLQFYHAASGGPRVLSIGVAAGFQQVIDVLLDTTSAGVVVLKSAHLNPLLQGQARTTRFSTVSMKADSLNVGRDQPPATTTYTQSSVTIESTPDATGRIFFAVSHDSNYVRILLQRDPTSGTLFWGSSPNRRIRVQLSYQGVPNVPFAKPGS